MAPRIFSNALKALSLIIGDTSEKSHRRRRVADSSDHSTDTDATVWSALLDDEPEGIARRAKKLFRDIEQELDKRNHQLTSLDENPRAVACLSIYLAKSASLHLQEPANFFLGKPHKTDFERLFLFFFFTFSLFYFSFLVGGRGSDDLGRVVRDLCRRLPNSSWRKIFILSLASPFRRFPRRVANYVKCSASILSHHAEIRLS